jgi:hypothetical protein
MRLWILALAASSCTGCLMQSLERHSLVQAGSVVDMRYREVIDNLALVANNPGSLPAYSTIFSGSAQVTDTGQVSSTTLWQRVRGTAVQDGFASEVGNPQVSRTLLQNWTLDPIVVPEKIEAMRCACRWALYGSEHTGDTRGLLASPDQAPGPGRHFGVADRLARLPVGWLHVDHCKSMPLGACYKAHCGNVWVWVMPDGMQGLAEFALVLQDIARVLSSSPTLFNYPPDPAVLRFEVAPPTGSKAECQFAVAVTLDEHGQLVPPQVYSPVRIDNVGAPANLRSQVNAAGGTSR